MPVLSFGVSEEEEVMIRHRMRRAGETNLSAHLRHAYFHGGADNEQIARLQKQISVLTDAVEQSQRLLHKMAGMRADNLELQLLAGLYLLLHPSVDPAVQATVDQYLRMDGVETFLRERGRQR